MECWLDFDMDAHDGLCFYSPKAPAEMVMQGLNIFEHSLPLGWPNTSKQATFQSCDRVGCAGSRLDHDHEMRRDPGTMR